MSKTRFAHVALLVTLPAVLASCSLKHADLGLGQALGTMMGRGLTCVFGSIFDAVSPSVHIEIEAVEFHAVTQMVFDRGAIDVPRFWAKLDADEVARLRGLVDAAYADLNVRSHLRDRPVGFYQDLLAQTMLDVIRENKQLSKFRGSRGMDVGGVHKTYAVSVELLNAGEPASKTFASCE